MAAAGLLLPLPRLADRKNKGPFDATLATPPERAAASRRRGPQQGGARCSVTVAGAGQAAQDGRGERRRGALWGGRWGGQADGQRGAHVQPCVPPRHGAHGAHETPRTAVSLGHPVERGLASMSRRDGGWVCGTFQMAEDFADHCALRDDGDDAQRPLMAKRTAGHIQCKHAPQKSGPGPIRGAPLRLLPVHPLLARGGNNRVAQVAVAYLRLSRFMIYSYASHERRHHAWPVYGLPMCRPVPQSFWI
jgi:hypothetical protein